MADYSVFAGEDFDPNEYANAILAGEQYPLSSDLRSAVKTTKSSNQEYIAKEDISMAISKLTSGIDDVSKQIKITVSVHHEALLLQATSANDMTGSLASVRSGLDDLDNSIEKLRIKVHVPYEALQAHVSRLHKLQLASDILRRSSRFVILARRLQMQMKEINDTDESASSKDDSMGAQDGIGFSTSDSRVIDEGDDKERTLAKAALSIAELMDLIDGPSEPRGTSFNLIQDTSSISKSPNGTTEVIPLVSLRTIKAVNFYAPFIEDARITVTSKMEKMVLEGLTTLNQTLLASSLQTGYNLRVLSGLIQNLITDLSQAVEGRIRTAFDLSKLSKEASTKDSTAMSPLSPQAYRSRVRTEPTVATAPQWATALWSRLEIMFEEMADCCIKVYTLEKILRMKKDTITQVVFLEEAMKMLENKPSAIFWTSLNRSLEKHFRDSAKSSTFLQQTLCTGYPRLLRLFHEFFGRIAVHTDTVYIDTFQSPETILILHSLSSIESLYISKSTNKINDAVGQAFSGGAHTPPGMNEGIGVARTILNELDSAKFDPLLVKTLAKSVVSCLDLMLARIEGLAIKDRSAIGLQGPTVTPQQVSNAQLATFVYHCWLRLLVLPNEHSGIVVDILKPNLQKLHRSYERLMDPLMTAIRRELGAIIAKVHRGDFGGAVDPISGMSGVASLYTKDLAEKLSFIKQEILSGYSLGEAGRTWIHSIVKFVIKTFLLHISIVNPLGESGKLQMTSDMTELEFALNAFMADGQNKRGGNLETVGDEYRALRAMRPLLFLENDRLASPESTSVLSPLIVLHHILVRSSIPLPHSLHGWQEAEYVRWIDEHTEEEAWTLIEGGLTRWEKISESEGVDIGRSMEYIELARTVLRNARGAV